MRPPVRVHALRSVRFEHRHMRAEPGGAPAAGRKPPAPGDPDSALDRDAATGARQIRAPRPGCRAAVRRSRAPPQGSTVGLVPNFQARMKFGLPTLGSERLLTTARHI